MRLLTCGLRVASETVCKPSSVPTLRPGTVIHLRRRLPDTSSGRPESGATHPCRTFVRRLSYLALLRVEFARFTRPNRLPDLPARLCGTGPRLSADGCYPLPCVAELGLSSYR